MTRPPANPADLGDLILGPTAGSAVALWSFSNAVGSDLVVLADLPARLTGPRITIASDPSTWDELLETTLGEVARRYSTALTSVQARRLYVVIDLDPLLSTPPALAEPERQLLLERLDELVQIGRAAAVHVLAIATDHAAGYRVSSTLRNTARVFRLPAADTATGGA